MKNPNLLDEYFKYAMFKYPDSNPVMITFHDTYLCMFDNDRYLVWSDCKCGKELVRDTSGNLADVLEVIKTVKFRCPKCLGLFDRK